MNLSGFLLNTFIPFLLCHWLLQVYMVVWFYTSNACWIKISFFFSFFKLLPDNSQTFFSSCSMRKREVAVCFVCRSWFYNNFSHLSCYQFNSACKEAFSFLRLSMSPSYLLYFYYALSEIRRSGLHTVFVIDTHHEFTSWHNTGFGFCSVFSFYHAWLADLSWAMSWFKPRP